MIFLQSTINSVEKMLKNSIFDDFDELFLLKKGEKDLWLDKYKPELLSELAVHKTKLQELEACLLKMFSGKAAVLLLSGPSGSAKTIALNLLAKKLNAEVQEWLNSLSDDFIPNNEDFFQQRFYSESQEVKFSDFLFRASRYNSLCFDEQETCGRKIALVKDFPNFLLREPSKLKDLLLKYNKTSVRHPLVFVCTDTEQSSSIKRKLFPVTLLTELGVEVIKFNSIAPTAMLKALQRICHSLPHAHPSTQVPLV